MISIVERLDAAKPHLQASTFDLIDGETFYNQGERLTDVYVIESGYVLLTPINASGQTTINLVLCTGELFGPGLLNDSEITTAAAVARGAVSIRRYHARQFRDHLLNDPALALEIIDMLARRQQFTEIRLQAVLTLDVVGRLAVVLHSLGRHYGGRCLHGHEVDIPLTQQQLAEMVGASRAAVNERLNELRRDGLLDYTREFICINDLEALQRLTAGVSMSSS